MNHIYISFAICLAVTLSFCHCSLVTLDEDTWTELLKGEWMVDFYAPWCPACKALEPEWKSFSSWSDDLGIKIGSVDVTANPGLSGRFMVTALPTIYHVKDGVFRQYKGGRDANTFVSFVEEKKWQSIEPISGWKSPDSFLMSVVSYFFKISMALRAVHNRLVEDYGIPYWGSYILFAFATILLGAILGLMIVCVIDLIFPAKPLIDTKKSDVNLEPDGDRDNSDLIDEEPESSKGKSSSAQGNKEEKEVRRRKTAINTEENQIEEDDEQ